VGLWTEESEKMVSSYGIKATKWGTILAWSITEGEGNDVL